MEIVIYDPLAQRRIGQFIASKFKKLKIENSQLEHFETQPRRRPAGNRQRLLKSNDKLSYVRDSI